MGEANFYYFTCLKYHLLETRSVDQRAKENTKQTIVKKSSKN